MRLRDERGQAVTEMALLLPLLLVLAAGSSVTVKLAPFGPT